MCRHRRRGWNTSFAGDFLRYSLLLLVVPFCSDGHRNATHSRVEIGILACRFRQKSRLFAPIDCGRPRLHFHTCHRISLVPLQKRTTTKHQMLAECSRSNENKFRKVGDFVGARVLRTVVIVGRCLSLLVWHLCRSMRASSSFVGIEGAIASGSRVPISIF